MDGNTRKAGLNVSIWIVLACLLAAYVGGYFLLGTRHLMAGAVPSGLPGEFRFQREVYCGFPSLVFVTMYKPMGLVESKIRGTSITVVHSNRIGTAFDFNVVPALPGPPPEPEYFDDAFDVVP